MLRRFYAANGYSLLGEFEEEWVASVAGFMLDRCTRAAKSRANAINYPE